MDSDWTGGSQAPGPGAAAARPGGREGAAGGGGDGARPRRTGGPPASWGFVCFGSIGHWQARARWFVLPYACRMGAV